MNPERDDDLRPAHAAPAEQAAGAVDDDDQDEGDEVDCAAPGDHEWVVFSTGGQRGDTALMLECARCGAYGTVHDSTLEEWSRETPYPWTDAARVVLRSDEPYGGYRHVEKRY